MEVLIVVVIVAITATLVMPMFGKDDPTKLIAGAQQLAGDLAFAQVESISHGDDLRVMVFDTVAHAYRITPASDTATPITNPVGGNPFSVTFGSGTARPLDGVTIQSLTVGGDDILGFGPYGELDQTTDATITLGAGGYTIVLTLNAISGEVAIGSVN